VGGISTVLRKVQLVPSGARGSYGTGGAGTNVSGSGGAIPDYYTGYIQLGGLTYGGTMSMAFGGSVLPDNTSFTIFSFTGSPTGSFGQILSTGYYAGTWTDNLDGTYSLAKDAQTLTFAQGTGILTIVPEPTTTVAIVTAIGLAAVCRRPRRPSPIRPPSRWSARSARRPRRLLLLR
jgi:hypothetical protein